MINKIFINFIQGLKKDKIIYEYKIIKKGIIEIRTKDFIFTIL